MRISTKGIYGTLAVLDLAAHQSTGHVHKADIAERQGIPEQYLAQLLSTLRRAGIVRSVRGPSGGHVLARDPREISVGDVIELLDGPQVTDHEVAANDPASRQVLAGLLREADEAAIGVLRGVTFEALVEQWRGIEGTVDFVI